jgi:hypothetical protein
VLSGIPCEFVGGGFGVVCAVQAVPCHRCAFVTFPPLPTATHDAGDPQDTLTESEAGTCSTHWLAPASAGLAETPRTNTKTAAQQRITEPATQPTLGRATPLRREPSTEVATHRFLSAATVGSGYKTTAT